MPGCRLFVDTLRSCVVSNPTRNSGPQGHCQTLDPVLVANLTADHGNMQLHAREVTGDKMCQSADPVLMAHLKSIHLISTENRH